MELKSTKDKCQALLESFDNSLVLILKNSTIPYNYIKKEILNPLGSIAPRILNEFGESKLLNICETIKNLIVIFVPERTTIEKVIEDFHHHHYCDRGYEKAYHSAHYEISREGIQKAKDYINKLGKT